MWVLPAPANLWHMIVRTGKLSDSGANFLCCSVLKGIISAENRVFSERMCAMRCFIASPSMQRETWSWSAGDSCSIARGKSKGCPACFIRRAGRSPRSTPGTGPAPPSPRLDRATAIRSIESLSESEVVIQLKKSAAKVDWTRGYGMES